jgi:hypothetical protein
MNTISACVNSRQRKRGTKSAFPRRLFQLAFPDNALEAFGRAFNPVLPIVPVARYQPYDLAFGRPGMRTQAMGIEIQGLPDFEFVV